MRRWHTEEGMSPHVIAVLLGCSPSTIHRRLAKAPGRVGHPRMSKADYQACNRALVAMQKEVRGRTEVTAAMVRRRAGLSYCERTIRDAFRAHGKPFKKLSEKPLLTPEDVKARLAFAEKYHARPKRSWLSCPHAIIDNKKFPMYVDHRGRVYAARRSVRGAYRSGADAVQSHLVKPKDTIKFPAAGVMVTAAVIRGKIRFWHITEGRWNAKKAVEMYKALKKAVTKAFPERAARPYPRWTILEDNDPSGYKSNLAVAEKQALRMEVMALPPRSPDLNVLDYSMWAAIGKRLRVQEADFPPAHKETRIEFLKRLRKTALTLPVSGVQKSVQSMKRRCQQIRLNKGGLIHE